MQHFAPATLRDFVTVHATIRGGRLNGSPVFRNLRRRVVRVLARDGETVAVRTDGGFVLRVPANDLHLMRELLGGTLFEPSVARALELVVRPGDTVVDGGAHVGFFTIVSARRVGPSGWVIAFEPDPDNARHWRRNVELNQLRARVVLSEAALGDRTGTATFHRSRSLSTHGSLLSSSTTDGSSDIVQTIALDEYVAEHGHRVDVIKLDLEGAEAIALNGMRESISQARCVIFELNAAPLRELRIAPEHLVARVLECGRFREACVLQVDSDAFLPLDRLSAELERRSWANVMAVRDGIDSLARMDAL